MDAGRTLTISLDEELSERVRSEVARGGWASVGDFVRAVLEDTLESQRADEIDAALKRGLADIEAGRVVDARDAFNQLETELRGRLGPAA